MEKTIEKKITKAMRINDIINYLRGEEVQNNSTEEEMIEFLEHELKLLSNRKSGKSKKDQETLAKKEQDRSLILDFLSRQTEGKTCTEILHGIPEFESNMYNNPMVTSLLKPLIDGGLVIRKVKKNRVYFSVPTTA